MSLLNRVFGLRLHHVFVRHGLPDKRPQFTVPPEYTNRIVPPTELLPFAGEPSADNGHLSEEFLRDSETRRDVCIASFFNDELVGFDFFSTTKAPVTDQLEIIVPPGFNYSYKSWTHPDHRRNHLSTIRIDVGRDPEVTSMYYVETHNYPSLLRPYRYPTTRRQHMGYIGWVEFRGREYPFASRRARWVGIEYQRIGAPKKRLYTEI